MRNIHPGSPPLRRAALNFLLLALAFLAPLTFSSASDTNALTRIGFGSCINTNQHPMLAQALEIPTDAFVLLGDNFYGDTTDVEVLRRKYRDLHQSDFYQALLRRGPVLATWDDHDYGANDAGAEYPQKIESQKLFLDFQGEPPDSPRRKREGIYDSRAFGPPGKRTQFIILDTRYFRGPLLKGKIDFVPKGGDYIPQTDPNSTLLGPEQWAWLEQQLTLPADLRIIASSIQFLSEFSAAEAWANFPHEKKRLLQLLEKTDAGPCLFISGDRHWAELSRLDRPGSSPLYDLTSSALTQKHPRGTPTPNVYRDGPTYHDANMGLITIDWGEEDLGILLQILDAQGNARIEKAIRLNR